MHIYSNYVSVRLSKRRRQILPFSQNLSLGRLPSVGKVDVVFQHSGRLADHDLMSILFRGGLVFKAHRLVYHSTLG